MVGDDPGLLVVGEDGDLGPDGWVEEAAVGQLSDVHAFLDHCEHGFIEAIRELVAFIL